MPGSTSSPRRCSPRYPDAAALAAAAARRRRGDHPLDRLLPDQDEEHHRHGPGAASTASAARCRPRWRTSSRCPVSGRKTGNVVRSVAFGLPGSAGRHPRRPAQPAPGADHRGRPGQGRGRPVQLPAARRRGATSACASSCTAGGCATPRRRAARTACWRTCVRRRCCPDGVVDGRRQGDVARPPRTACRPCDGLPGRVYARPDNQVPATWFAGDAGIRRLALPCATAPQGAVAIFPDRLSAPATRACSTARAAAAQRPLGLVQRGHDVGVAVEPGARRRDRRPRSRYRPTCSAITDSWALSDEGIAPSEPAAIAAPGRRDGRR